MKFSRLVFFAAMLVNAVPLAANATPQDPATSTSATPDAPAVAEPAAPATATTKLAARELPKLVLRWECGGCDHNEKVFPLIEQTYASDAAAAGYTVSESETAEVAITAYRQRPPAARVMLGFMAGRDTLKTRVTFRGKATVAGDYSANAFQGMNNLCAAVSRKAMVQILAGLQPQ
jgi:hypothetical protein